MEAAGREVAPAIPRPKPSSWPWRVDVLDHPRAGFVARLLHECLSDDENEALETSIALLDSRISGLVYRQGMI
jgi:hypothetical protein